MQQWSINQEFLQRVTEVQNEGVVKEMIIKEAEELAWESKRSLTEDEIKDLISIQSILKDKTPHDRKTLAAELKLQEQMIETCKKVDNQLQILDQWFQLRDSELANDRYPKHEWNLEQTRFSEVWKGIFGTEYEKTTQDQLHQATVRIFERLHLLRKNRPYLINYLLTQISLHPNIYKLDKQLLSSMLQIFSFNLQLDSDDLRSLV